MSYTAPAGNSVAFDLTGAYTAPAGNAVLLDTALSGALSGSVSESFSITDTPDAVAVVVYDVGVVEDFTLTDSTDSTYTLVYEASVVESLSITDVPDGVNNIPVAATESFAITDTMDYSVTLQKNVVESFAVRDVVTKSKSADTTVVESFAITDFTDFHAFPVDIPGIHFDWRINHLHYAAPAGNALDFDVPQDGQYFYSKDNLITLPAQLIDLPGTWVNGGDPLWADVVLNIDFKPVSGHPDWYTDTSLLAHSIATYYVDCNSIQSRFGPGYGVADLPDAITGPNAYIFANDSDDWWFGADPFTIDVSVMWRTDLYAIQAFICQWGGYDQCGWWLGYINGRLGFHWSTDGSDNFWLEVPFEPVVGMWYDISVDRASDGTLRLYVNDSVIGTIVCTANLFNSNRRLMLGCDDNSGGYGHVTFQGYIGAARITKMNARYQGVKPPLYYPYPLTTGSGDLTHRVGIQPTIPNFPHPYVSV